MNESDPLDSKLLNKDKQTSGSFKNSTDDVLDLKDGSYGSKSNGLSFLPSAVDGNQKTQPREQGDQTYHCPKCTYSTKNDTNLQTITKIQRTRMGEGPFKCDHRGDEVLPPLQKNDVGREMLVHSGGEKPFVCDHCCKDFKRKAHLLIHSGELPFKCNLCNKAFNQRSNLKKHQVIHSDEKRFPCNQCDNAFAKKECLRQHKIVHSGEKPFLCSFCNKAFNDRSNLKRHFRIHTGEKPHSCDLCNRAFAQLDNLSRHKVS